MTVSAIRYDRRNGSSCRPHVIDEAVSRIRNGSITNVVYDPMKASLVGIAP